MDYCKHNLWYSHHVHQTLTQLTCVNLPYLHYMGGGPGTCLVVHYVQNGGKEEKEQGMLARCGVGGREEPPSDVNFFPRSATDMAPQATELQFPLTFIMHKQS